MILLKIYLMGAVITAYFIVDRMQREDCCGNENLFKRNRAAAIITAIVFSAAFPLFWITAHKAQKEIENEARKKEQERVDELLKQLDERAAERKKDMDRITSRYNS